MATTNKSSTSYTTAGEWTNYLKQRYGSYYDVYKQNYDATVGGLKQQASYDISSAYSNYLNQQMAVNRNNQLFSGYKDQYGDYLKNNYASTYSGIASKLNENVYNAYNTYSDAVSDLDKQLNTQAKGLQQYEAYLPEYFLNTYLNDPKNENYNEYRKLLNISEDYSTAEEYTTGWSDLAYDTMFNVDNQGNRTYTDEAKAMLAELLLSGNGEGFSKWLRDTKGQKAYDDWVDTYATEFQDIITDDAGLGKYIGKTDGLDNFSNRARIKELNKGLTYTDTKGKTIATPFQYDDNVDTEAFEQRKKDIKELYDSLYTPTRRENEILEWKKKLEELGINYEITSDDYQKNLDNMRVIVGTLTKKLNDDEAADLIFGFNAKMPDNVKDREYANKKKANNVENYKAITSNLRKGDVLKDAKGNQLYWDGKKFTIFYKR